jgi:hypothetical protein
VFSWALVIVFAYGMHGLSRRYLEIAAGAAAAPPDDSEGRARHSGRVVSAPAQTRRARSDAPHLALGEHLRSWWSKVKGFDRKWSVGCLLAVGASLLGWLIYASARKGLEDYLQTVQFDEGTAKAIAGFSFQAVGWYVLFLLLAVGLVTLVLSGWFAGRRAKWGGILLGVLLVADLGRANLPWILHWDYKQKYDVDPANSANSINPIINFLRERPFEHRVANFPMDRFLRMDRLPPEAAPLARLYSQLSGLYEIEWKQHHFPYYNVQCLDIIQEPRVAADKAAFEAVMIFAPLRRWELTNTRYLFSPAALLEVLNGQIDPGRKRFRIATRFDIAPKPGVSNPTRYEHLTAMLNTNGACALFDFTGALPRAKLYANWKVSTNDPARLRDWVKEIQPRVPAEWASALAAQSPVNLATLHEMADEAFDPSQTVLLAEPLTASPGTNQNPGEVRFESYAPKHIVLRAKAETPAVLLLNDKFDPAWKVLVDGKPETLLRANFIMRGVYLQPGEHTVEFQFVPKVTMLYVSLSAIGVGVLLLGFLIFSSRREAADSLSIKQQPT